MNLPAQLLHSLSFDIHNQPTNVHNEVALCTKFIESYTEEVAADLGEKGVSGKLIEAIATKRICSLSWIGSRPPRKWFHPLLRICRVLLRDKLLIDRFHESHLHSNFVQFCEYISTQYFAHDNSSEFAQSVSTLLNILQKLCTKKEYVELLVECKLCKCILELLSSRDMSILQGALEVLGRLSDFSAQSRVELCASTAIDVCLQLAPSSDLLTQKLCVSLLRILSCEEQAREQIKIYDGVPLLVGLLSVKNCRLQWHVAWSLAQLAEDIETATEIATLGGVSLALTLLHVGKVPERGIADWIAMMTGVCALLAQLCQSDRVQLQIVNGNGIFVLGHILLLHLNSSTLAANPNYNTLQCSVFRVLRLLFSLERNRHFFKKVFASDFFAAFIDVGHYVHDLSAYHSLVEHYNAAISMRTVEENRADWDAVNLRRDPIGTVGEYELLEQLGAGAFGCVYTVRKRSKDLAAAPQYLALKEIYMNAMQSDSDVNKSFGDIISEVKIIKQQLRHPNIVRYRKIFVESHRLYIVMDLIEGASLKEHINSTKEKREKFDEGRVWSITIQLILALRYLHKEKRIVHRDLKPNNIMLTDSDRVVITDFGLAKQKGADYLKSAAGTIIYSCPEVVQHLPYGEKADIWSFGCCLYEVCCLKPAFYSQNMLQLATLIVEGKYDPIEETYSEQIRGLVSYCLKTSPSERPDIDGVAALVAPRLILCLDEVFRRHSQNTQESSQRMFSYTEFATGSKRPPSSSLNSSTSSAAGGGSSARILLRRRKSLSAEVTPPKIPSGSTQNPPTALKLPPIVAGNIDKPKRELKSLSAGNTSKGRVRLPLSTTLPTIAPAAPTRRLTVAAVRTHKRASSSGAVDKSDPLLTLRSGALRPTVDPVVQILAAIQRIFQISQSSIDGSALSYKKRLVEQFQRNIFGRSINPGVAKRELRKLVLEANEEVPLDLGFADFRPVLTDLPLPPELSMDRKITRITYEQLAASSTTVNKTSTTTPSTLTTSPSPPLPPMAVNISECGCDVPNLYLDVMFVVSTANDLSHGDVQAIEFYLESVILEMTLGQGIQQVTRIGLVVYSDSAQLVFPLSSFNNTDDFFANFNIPIPASPMNRNNLYEGLFLAKAELDNNVRQGFQPVIVIITQTFDPIVDPSKIAASFRRYGRIITIQYFAEHGTDADLIPQITELASTNYNLSNRNRTLHVSQLHDLFCEANCYCPAYWQIYKRDHFESPTMGCYKMAADNRFVTYSEAQRTCRSDNGALVSLEDLEKANWIQTMEHDIYAQWIGLVCDRDAPLHTFVGNVELERGPTYRIATNDEAFRLNLDTGQIFTRASLDRETTSVHQLLLISTLPSIVHIEIFIDDVNDNAPLFSSLSQNVTIAESAPIGSRIPLTPAVDPDSGINGKIVGYEITDGDSQEHFKIVYDPEVDNVLMLEIIKPLDHEKHPLFTLTLSANDGGLNARSSTTKLEITVLDVNDNTPQFDQSEYMAIWSGNLKDPITRLSTRDEDSGQNGVVSLVILGPATHLFTFDSTGRLFAKENWRACCASQITCVECSIPVRAIDHGNPPLSSTTSITVKLNEGKPGEQVEIRFKMYPPGVDFALVEEESRVGRTIAVVSGTLKIVNGNENGIFSLKGSPKLSLLRLERDASAVTKDQFLLTFQAISNSGNYSSKKTLQIKGAPGATFRIIKGGDDFEIDSVNGIMVSKKDLWLKSNRETEIDAEVETIWPPPSIHPTNTRITLKVLDVNNHSPLIQTRIENLLVSEDSPIGETLITILAKDQDLGKNAQLEYFLLTPTPVFKIEKQTGKLILLQALDYEKRKEFLLEMEICDMGKPRLCAREKLNIYVKDVNDNPPIFLWPTQFLAIPRTIEIDQKNAARYEKLSGPIEIDEFTGVLTLSSDLDLHINSSIPFSVLAISPDGVKESLLRMIEIDSSQKTPKFLQQKLNLSVTSQTPIGAELQKIEFDEEVAHLSFSSDCAHLWVDERTRVIRTKALFDLPLDQIQCSIKASNAQGGSDEMQLILNVDQKIEPTVKSHLRVVVEENVSMGTRIGNLSSFHSSHLIFSLDSLSKNSPIGVFPTGELFIRRLLDREENSFISLAVIASHSSKSNKSNKWRTEVEILVEDVNDNAPECEEKNGELPKFAVESTKSPGSEIGELACRDKDLGLNGYVVYELIDNIPWIALDLHGRIFLSSLIPANVSEVTVAYSVADLAHLVPNSKSTSLKSSCKFVIEIAREALEPKIVVNQQKAVSPLLFPNVNSNTAPIFEKVPKEVLIEKWDLVGKMLFQIQVTSLVPVKFNSLSPNFYVNSKGSVILNEIPERITDRFLLIEAEQINKVKHGELVERIHSRLSIPIRLADSPSDSQSLFPTCHIKENVKYLSEVWPEIETNEKITLLQKIPSDCPIENISDRLRVVAALDREKTSECQFFLKTIDDRQVIHRLLKVIVDDENDNRPICDGLRTFVVSQLPTVIPIQCHDRDSAENGTLHYSIPQIDGVRVQQDGHLIVDRLIAPLTNISITVTDMALTNPHSTIIEIKMLNLSTDFDLISDFDLDQIPILRANLSTSLGTRLGKIDLKGLNVAVSGAPDGGPFIEINEKGEMFLSKKLSSYPQSLPHIITFYTQKARKDFTLELVVDDDVLMPEKSQVFFVLNKNTPKGFRLGKLNDRECEFSTTNPFFKIHSKSGVIQLTNDLPKGNLIDFMVDLERKNGLRAQVKVNVAIVGIEHFPRNNDAQSRESFFFVPENSPFGTPVGQLAPKHSHFYSLISGHEDFVIDPKTAIIRTKRSLDREMNPIFFLSIRETNSYGYSTEKNVTVFVEDENDSIPTCVKTKFNVSEETISETIIGRIQWNDEDSDTFFNPTIVAGDEENLFAVYSNGDLKLLGELDYEKKKEHHLLIKLTDDRLPFPSHSIECQVIVQVEDINDNSPIFIKQTTFIAKETATTGEVIGLLTTMDKDSNINAQVKYRRDGSMSEMTYSIISGNTSLFSIESDTGKLLLLNDLDAEINASHELIVEVKDGGSPRLSATTRVLIDVLNINDNSPQFSQNFYQATVKENDALNSLVLQVDAEDCDNEDQNLYQIIDCDECAFKINSTGALLLSESLERDGHNGKSSYNFRIRATDTGRVYKRSTDVKIEIKIEDVNDNSPTISNRRVDYFIPSIVKAGDLVFYVAADDLDENDRLRFKLFGNDADFFQINRQGLLFAKNDLPLKTEFSFGCTVVDTVGHKSSTSFTLYPTNNPNFPTFTPLSNDYIKISENVKRQITQVNASVARDSKIPIEYSIESSNERHFSIDPMGNLRTNGLDFEKERNVTVIVSGCTKESPSLCALLPIQIHLNDQNDNAPIFEKQLYTINVMENSNCRVLLTVKAVDIDDGQNSEIIYSLPDQFKHKFSIDRKSGELFLLVPLDREERKRYELTVTATDQGEPPRNGTTLVQIEILNEDDNPLRFTRLDHASIPEDSPIGSQTSYYRLRVRVEDLVWSVETAVAIQILDINDNHPTFYNIPTKWIIKEQGEFGKINATDGDFGENSRIRYSLQQAPPCFYIDPLSGLLFFNCPIVFRKPVNITIRADDHGIPILSSYVTVPVFFEDQKPAALSAKSKQLIKREKRINAMPPIVLEALNSQVVHCFSWENLTLENCSHLYSIGSCIHFRENSQEMQQIECGIQFLESANEWRTTIRTISPRSWASTPEIAPMHFQNISISSRTLPGTLLPVDISKKNNSHCITNNSIIQFSDGDFILLKKLESSQTSVQIYCWNRNREIYRSSLSLNLIADAPPPVFHKKIYFFTAYLDENLPIILNRWHFYTPKNWMLTVKEIEYKKLISIDSEGTLTICGRMSEGLHRVTLEVRESLDASFVASKALLTIKILPDPLLNENSLFGWVREKLEKQTIFRLNPSKDVRSIALENPIYNTLFNLSSNNVLYLKKPVDAESRLAYFVPIVVRTMNDSKLYTARIYVDDDVEHFQQLHQMKTITIFSSRLSSQGHKSTLIDSLHPADKSLFTCTQTQFVNSNCSLIHLNENMTISVEALDELSQIKIKYSVFIVNLPQVTEKLEKAIILEGFGRKRGLALCLSMLQEKYPDMKFSWISLDYIGFDRFTLVLEVRDRLGNSLSSSDSRALLESFFKRNQEILEIFLKKLSMDECLNRCPSETRCTPTLIDQHKEHSLRFQNTIFLIPAASLEIKCLLISDLKISENRVNDLNKDLSNQILLNNDLTDLAPIQITKNDCLKNCETNKCSENEPSNCRKNLATSKGNENMSSLMWVYLGLGITSTVVISIGLVSICLYLSRKRNYAKDHTREIVSPGWWSSPVRNENRKDAKEMFQAVNKGLVYSGRTTPDSITYARAAPIDEPI
ncbi:unnamed protein product, partial [Mesorhabditis belari]|uniref:Uncharacterized protein n=1 Tax=Mesorhabditis belari TaxID=2138241 RepID=A0AAF3EBA7_9BILA